LIRALRTLDQESEDADQCLHGAFIQQVEQLFLLCHTHHQLHATLQQVGRPLVSE
jgi:hypothetical protein